MYILWISYWYETTMMWHQTVKFTQWWFNPLSWRCSLLNPRKCFFIFCQEENPPWRKVQNTYVWIFFVKEIIIDSKRYIHTQHCTCHHQKLCDCCSKTFLTLCRLLKERIRYHCLSVNQIIINKLSIAISKCTRHSSLQCNF